MWQNLSSSKHLLLTVSKHAADGGLFSPSVLQMSVWSPVINQWREREPKRTRTRGISRFLEVYLYSLCRRNTRLNGLCSLVLSLWRFTLLTQYHRLWWKKLITGSANGGEEGSWRFLVWVTVNHWTPVSRVYHDTRQKVWMNDTKVEIKDFAG